MRDLGLKCQKEFWSYAKAGLLPKDIPTNPHVVYKSCGWSGYSDWLGRIEDKSKVAGPSSDAPEHRAEVPGAAVALNERERA